MKRYYLIERKSYREYGDRYCSLIEVDFSNKDEKKAFSYIRDFIEMESLDKIICVNKYIRNYLIEQYNACITKYDEILSDYCFEDNFFRMENEKSEV